MGALKNRQSKTRPATKAMTRIRRKGEAGATALRHRRRLKGIVITISIAVMIALFYVWSRVAVVQTGYRLHYLTNEYLELEDRFRSLKIELATRLSPDQLGSYARTQLGLQPPQAGQVVIVPDRIRLAGESYQNSSNRVGSVQSSEDK